MTISYHDAVRWVREFAFRIAENRDYLTDLDSAIGDADHGINMDRGMRAVVSRIDGLAVEDIGAMFKAVGMALVSSVGGAGGPLYGTLFMQLGSASSGKAGLEPEDWAAALEAAVRGVQTRGKAEPGDKTMLDALFPARDALRAAVDEGVPFEVALHRAAAAGEEGMKKTVPLVARKGRASYLGERSAGHQDPGATSSYLLLKTAADVWGGAAGSD